MRTIDALPTIAEAAGVRVPWRTDGMPAGERPVDASTPIAVTGEGSPGEPVALGTVLDGRREREAAEARLLRGGEYAIGPRPDLIGRRATAPPLADGARATVDAPREFAAIAAGARVLPVLVSGDVTGLPDDEPIAHRRQRPGGRHDARVPARSIRRHDPAGVAAPGRQRRRRASTNG